MGGDILPVFTGLAVDVAGQVQVVVVAFDLGQGNPTRVAGKLGGAGEAVDDLVDVLGAQAVLEAVLHEAAAGVDHEEAAGLGVEPGLGFGLVDHDDAGGDAGAVKEVGRQADDALEVTPADQVAADVGLRVAAEEDAMRQDAGAGAVGLLCGIMFMRARPLVAASFSWP